MLNNSMIVKHIALIILTIQYTDDYYKSTNISSV